MKIKLLILFILFGLIKVKSQVSTSYTFSETTGTYTPITGGSQLVTTTGGATAYDTDGNNITIPSGSQFVFNTFTITSVNMTADGSLWLNPSTTTTGNGVTGPIASGAAAAGVIAGMGMDLRSTAIASQVYERRWQDDGTEVIFQWQNCSRFSQSTVERFSFQIRINKLTGTVRIIYGNMTTIANSTTYQPQVGLRGTTNTDFNTRRLTNSFPDAAPNWGAPNGTGAATSNANIVRFTSNGSCFPNSGLIFIWTYIGSTNNNDLCSNATIITVPYNSGIVSTIGSTSDVPTSASSCATQGNNLWYKIAGNNKNLIATTCNTSTNFDTEIRIYTGDCSSLNSMIEVDCDDDDAFCSYSTIHSTVTWCASIGTDYYLSIGYFSSNGGTGDFVLSVTENGNCSVLPIELLFFSGTINNGYNLLKWSTASEMNNNYFTIERSIDGLDWIVVDKINGAGNSNYKIDYEYKDYDFSNNETNYYRLKQTDYDGKSEYSNIIYLENKKTNAKLIKVINLMGNDVDADTKGVVIFIYEDGSVVKKFNF